VSGEVYRATEGEQVGDCEHEADQRDSAAVSGGKLLSEFSYKAYKNILETQG